MLLMREMCDQTPSTALSLLVCLDHNLLSSLNTFLATSCLPKSCFEEAEHWKIDQNFACYETKVIMNFAYNHIENIDFLMSLMHFEMWCLVIFIGLFRPRNYVGMSVTTLFQYPAQQSSTSYSAIVICIYSLYFSDLQLFGQILSYLSALLTFKF